MAHLILSNTVPTEEDLNSMDKPFVVYVNNTKTVIYKNIQDEQEQLGSSESEEDIFEDEPIIDGDE